MVSMCGFIVNIFTDGVVNSARRAKNKNVKLLLWGSETVINCLMLTDGISRKLNEEKIQREERFTLLHFT